MFDYLWMTILSDIFLALKTSQFPLNSSAQIPSKAQQHPLRLYIRSEGWLVKTQKGQRFMGCIGDCGAQDREDDLDVTSGSRKRPLPVI